MGGTLSQPITDKFSSDGQDSRLIYASSEMQGWRISMEDAHTTILELLPGKKDFSFFAVYDGHGGQSIAKYSGANLHDRIVNSPEFEKGDYHESIRQGFLGTDTDLKNDIQYAHDPSGCTAVTSLITPDNKIFVGNAGDSRAVLSVRGEAFEMSEDHKPGNKEESERIRNAGGFVEFNRVNGNLALSRAIGDFEFKQNPELPAEKQIVTALPDVKEYQIDNETEFLVLACDGIWDCLSSPQVISFIRREISRGYNLRSSCENLMDRCLECARGGESGGIGCDNMTVIIVGFLQGRTEKEWYKWISDRVEQGIGPAHEDEKPPPLHPSLLSPSTDLNDDSAEGLEVNNDDDAPADDHPERFDRFSPRQDSGSSIDSDFSSRSNSGTVSSTSSHSSFDNDNPILPVTNMVDSPRMAPIQNKTTPVRSSSSSSSSSSLSSSSLSSSSSVQPEVVPTPPLVNSPSLVKTPSSIQPEVVAPARSPLRQSSSPIQPEVAPAPSPERRNPTNEDQTLHNSPGVHIAGNNIHNTSPADNRDGG